MKYARYIVIIFISFILGWVAHEEEHFTFVEYRQTEDEYLAKYDIETETTGELCQERLTGGL
jgi:hypothetical protein